MTYDALDTAFWGMPFCTTLSYNEAKTLDFALWGMPLCMNVPELSYFAVGL